MENITKFEFSSIYEAYPIYTKLVQRLLVDLPYTIDKDDKARALEQTMLVNTAKYALPIMLKNLQDGFHNFEEEIQEFNMKHGAKGPQYYDQAVERIRDAILAIEELT